MWFLAIDVICKKTAYHSVLGQTIDHLRCHARQYQDPTKPKDKSRKPLVLSKYQTCGSETHLNTTIKRPQQSMVFGGSSFQMVVKTTNHYVQLVHICLGHYINRTFSSSSSLTAELALDITHFLHERGLVVNQCVPTTLQEIEKNTQIKSLPRLASAGEPYLPPKSKSDRIWELITVYYHPQTGDNLVDGDVQASGENTQMGSERDKHYAVVRRGMSPA